jgi:hypothetical protein
MTCGKPNWQLLKEAGEILTNEGKSPFTRGQLIESVLKLHPGIGENTLNPMIQGMTVNLKGGAPGAVGKNVFYSVDRGMFQIYNGAKTVQNLSKLTHEIVHENPSKPLDHNISEELGAETEVKQSESEIRDLLMQVLFHRLGNGTWTGDGKAAQFDVRTEGFKCWAERSLSYDVPGDQKLSHCSDILISNSGQNRHISLEIKHRSAVTDQFKCRAYDIMHLKQTYGNNLLGVVVYVKSTPGISVRQAQSICYPFDHFFSVDSGSRHNPTVWNALVSAIEAFVSK